MDNWIELLVTYDEIEAQIVKNILDSEHIESVIRSSKIRPYPTNIGKIGEVRLLVREKDLKKAQEVIRIMQDTSENG